MRQFTFSILFLLSSLLQAQTTWYIDPAGNDGTGDGTIGNPWATLYKACTMIPDIQGAAGDIIHVNAGTYNETQQCELSPDISIEGANMATTIINTTWVNTGNWEGCILLSGGTNTSQHISEITLDGQNLTAQRGIAVYGRNNVDIYNVTVRNFQMHGIEIGGVGNADNELSFFSIINCGGQPNHTANLRLSNCVRLKVHHGTITQTARATNLNGNCIGGYEALYDCEIYNNAITAMPYLTDGIWKFAIELFHPYGLEIYNNILKGEVDFGQDINPGVYAYGLYFHNNTCGWDSPIAYVTNGLQCEQTAEGVIVANNIFKNLHVGIRFCQYNYADDFVEDIQIYNNQIYNVGYTGGSAGYGIFFESGPILPIYYDNIEIYNNTIVGNATYVPDAGITLPSGDEVTNIIIRNNIVQGFDIAPVYVDRAVYGTIDYLWIENNLFYDNGNSNAPLYVHPASPNHVTYQNNVIDDPDFDDPDNFDFHIQAGSPANNAGYNLALSASDYDAVTWDSPPAIGAFEYAEIPPGVPTVSTTAISDIEETTASGGGNVTDDGGSAVTARGVCWSVSHNPTTADSKTTNGSGLGVFTSDLTGLTGGLTYYVRAYATNGVATSYGAEVNFTSGTSCLCGKLVRFLGKLVRHGSKLVKY